MSTRDLLEANCERLVSQYNAHIQGVLTLQTTLIRDILPSVTDELELSPEATDWAKEWLDDPYTLFRISRRNKFTRSFAMESIRKNLIWRLNNLWPLEGRSLPIPMIHCLPGNAHDPFGRPILVIETLPLDIDLDAIRPLILRTFERLRAHLKCLNDTLMAPEKPTLQYIVLLDLQGLSLRSFDTELLRWILREIIPRFPGMLAGVFMLNYSWVYSGVWSVARRVLPASALSRVFFPSSEELIDYFTPSSLPKDYGGSLLPLTLLDDPLRKPETPPDGIQPYAQNQPPVQPSPSPLFTMLSPTSILNPFFGYPTDSSDGYLSLHHGRRRKRDLARTLALLFWIRWRKTIVVGLVLVMCALSFKLGKRFRYPRFLRSFWAGKTLSFRTSTKLPGAVTLNL
ncbi:Protein real-time [Hypsizygus marmoreus]|uniref:Protein real-time n=1 Tax=Hypsizygus marmoreus TaxID=39966 RepID=A0A369JYP1_HYPMA|nr:Protein real-time [Hypsizygus marmoreus]